MSFMLTVPQFKARTKTVTRRNGWINAQPGDVVMGVVKGQGLKKGEKVVRLGRIRFVSVRREALADITAGDVWREGFPELTRDEFVAMYCLHNKCGPLDLVTRIEFEYLDA